MGCCDAPGLMPIDDAIEQMLSSVTEIKTTQQLALENTVGFVLAEDILSPINVPPFDNSAMDGYAIKRNDLVATNILQLAGKSFAGQPFEGNWPTGTCIRIMTGAKIPQGCDAVVMQEDTVVTDNGIEFNNIDIKAGNNIRPIGDDIKRGDIVLAKGSRLTPRDIPMIASLGISHLTVFDKPKVAFFSTGDELIPLGEELKQGQIYDSNRYGLKILLEKFGCEGIDLGIIPDVPEKLRDTFNHAQQIADVVITSGGVSVGEADYTKDILEQLGSVSFWKIAIKPGKPFAFGRLNDAWFCGLPGNPVSAALTTYVLVQPMLAKLSAESNWAPPQNIPATTKSAFNKKPGRTDYQRGVYTVKDGKFEVVSAGNQSSGAFTSMSVANCFVILEHDRGRVDIGDTVQIQPFNHTQY
ncbi:molybdopterin molybdotransferase MoeA [Vibrio sp. MA40-2]|uniref:molybdopterin molybdotransferase MoeA n=1 Tax=Vibrio sp. MA40-2 TaxID=3391828 RepID=UPI0039A7201C